MLQTDIRITEKNLYKNLSVNISETNYSLSELFPVEIEINKFCYRRILQLRHFGMT
jgi:hypothetical protein